MVTPRKIAHFVGLVMAVLFVISLLFSIGGNTFSEKLGLKFPTVKDIFDPEPTEYADISGLIAYSKNLEDTAYATMAVALPDIDTLNDSTKEGFDTVRANSGVLKNKTHPIEFPVHNLKLLVPFFKNLSQSKKLNRPVRIMHYGDSQIEGDRITSYIRDKMQLRFGEAGLAYCRLCSLMGSFR
jgi:hypothetical protein